MGLCVRGSNTNRGNNFFFFSNTSRPPLRPTQLPVQSVRRVLSTGVKRWVLKWTARVRLLLWLRICGSVPLLPHCAFVVCTGTNLRLHLHLRAVVIKISGQ